MGPLKQIEWQVNNQIKYDKLQKTNDLITNSPGDKGRYSGENMLRMVEAQMIELVVEARRGV